MHEEFNKIWRGVVSSFLGVLTGKLLNTVFDFFDPGSKDRKKPDKKRGKKQ